MSTAIEDFELLKQRWPGILNIVKAINGFDVDCSYEELLELNEQISSDPEGMEIATRATMKLMEGFEDQDPKVRKWLEENGFVSQKAIDAQKEMDEILEAIESEEYHTQKELDAMAKRLLDIQEEFIRSSQKHANAIGKGLFGIKTALSE